MSRLAYLADWHGLRRPEHEIVFSKVKRGMVKVTPYLNRYSSRLGYRGGPFRNRYQALGALATAAGLAAYKKRGKFKRLWRRFRKWNPNIGRRSVGEPKNTSTAKVYTVWELANINKDGRIAYFDEITNIPGSTGAYNTVRNTRDRNVINISGLKMYVHVKNNATSPVLFNIAVLQPKNSTGVSATNFFKDMGNPTYPSSRGRDFNTNLSGIEMSLSNINTDKFNILWHVRRRIGPDGTGGGYVHNADNNSIVIKRYLKIGKQFRYDEDVTPKCQTPMYIVYWGATITSAAGTPVAASQLTLSTLAVVFFRENKA